MVLFLTPMEMSRTTFPYMALIPPTLSIRLMVNRLFLAENGFLIASARNPIVLSLE